MISLDSALNEEHLPSAEIAVGGTNVLPEKERGPLLLTEPLNQGSP